MQMSLALRAVTGHSNRALRMPWKLLCVPPETCDLGAPTDATLLEGTGHSVHPPAYRKCEDLRVEIWSEGGPAVLYSQDSRGLHSVSSRTSLLPCTAVLRPYTDMATYGCKLLEPSTHYNVSKTERCKSFARFNRRHGNLRVQAPGGGGTSRGARGGTERGRRPAE